MRKIAVVSLVLLGACTTAEVRKPAIPECVSGVCVYRVPKKMAEAICSAFYNNSVKTDACFMPELRAAWEPEPGGKISPDICLLADDYADCRLWLFPEE